MMPRRQFATKQEVFRGEIRCQGGCAALLQIWRGFAPAAGCSTPAVPNFEPLFRTVVSSSVEKIRGFPGVMITQLPRPSSSGPKTNEKVYPSLKIATDKRDTVRPIPASPLRGPGSGKQLVDAKHWLEKFLRGKRVDEKHPRYSSVPECNANSKLVPANLLQRKTSRHNDRQRRSRHPTICNRLVSGAELRHNLTRQLLSRSFLQPRVPNAR